MDDITTARPPDRTDRRSATVIDLQLASRHRAPRLQNLSDRQMDQLVRLLAMTDKIDELLLMAEKLTGDEGCPVAKLIIGKP